MSVIYDRKEDNFAVENEMLLCVLCDSEINCEPYIRWEAYSDALKDFKQSRICGSCSCKIRKGLTLDLTEIKAARDMNIAAGGENWVRLKRITAKSGLSEAPKA
jgi:hypothetical protein